MRLIINEIPNTNNTFYDKWSKSATLTQLCQKICKLNAKVIYERVHELNIAQSYQFSINNIELYENHIMNLDRWDAPYILKRHIAVPPEYYPENNQWNKNFTIGLAALVAENISRSITPPENSCWWGYIECNKVQIIQLGMLKELRL